MSIYHSFIYHFKNVITAVFFFFFIPAGNWKFLEKQKIEKIWKDFGELGGFRADQ